MLVRQRFWVDGSVQGVLIGRIVIYWGVAVLYAILGTACFQYYDHPQWTFVKHIQALFTQFWPWIPSMILFVPLVIHDINRLSNLFAGPIYRLRKHLAVLTENPDCQKLTFREDDYWQDLVAPINRLQEQIVTLRSEVAELKSKAEKPRNKLAPNLQEVASAANFLVQPPAGGKPAVSMPSMGGSLDD